MRSLSNKKRVIRLPHRQEEKLRKINKIYNNLSQVLMREPTLQEIAEEIGLEEEEVASIINSSTLGRLAGSPRSRRTRAACTTWWRTGRSTPAASS